MEDYNRDEWGALEHARHQDTLSREKALTVVLIIVGVFALWVGLMALVVALVAP
jgi:flagellar basal body-associated protein FliL